MLITDKESTRPLLDAKEALIGLDLGSTNAKAIAYTIKGEIITKASTPYPTYYPRPGWSEQKPREWENALKASLSRASIELKKGGYVAIGLGLSAHAPGILFTAANERLIFEEFPIWQDSRSLSQSQQLYRDLGADWIGLGFPIASFPAKLLWYLQNKPEVMKNARYALGIKAYLIHWLTGNYATDPSSEPANVREWQALCDYCGWSLDRLPPLLNPTDVAGEIRNELADELGLPRKLPVIIGINDGGSAALSTGAISGNECVIQLATNGVVYMATSLPIPSAIRYEHAIFCWRYLEGSWIAGGQTKCGAENLDWLINLLTGAFNPATVHNLLDEASTSPCGSRGVIFLPYLMGRGTPRDNALARGAFCGLNLSTSRSDLCRAVLEGVAFSIREIFEDFSQLGYSPGNIHITGGGAQSALWRQILVNVLDRTIIYSAADSCLGSAILAAVGLRKHPDINTAIKEMVRSIEVIKPQPEATPNYQQIFEQYLLIGSNLTDVVME